MTSLPRARLPQLGLVIGTLPTGPLDAITDVAGHGTWLYEAVGDGLLDPAQVRQRLSGGVPLYVTVRSFGDGGGFSQLVAPQHQHARQHECRRHERERESCTDQRRSRLHRCAVGRRDEA